jgi:hypothetical protein
MTFKEAFADARSKKQATFDWKGKSYSTQLKGEEAGKTQRPKARPKASEAERPKVAGAQRPKARPANKGPSVMSEAPKQGTAPKADAPVVAGKAGSGPKISAIKTAVPKAKTGAVRTVVGLPSPLEKAMSGKSTSPGAARRKRPGSGAGTSADGLISKVKKLFTGGGLSDRKAKK